MSNAHKVKLNHEYFDSVKSGIKTFEIRENDRDYKVGDTLILQDYLPDEEQFTGLELKKKIIFITDYHQEAGWVVLGIAEKEPVLGCCKVIRETVKPLLQFA